MTDDTKEPSAQAEPSYESSHTDTTSEQTCAIEYIETIDTAEDNGILDTPRLHNEGIRHQPDSSLMTRAIIAAVIILAALTALGSILTIGDHLMSANGVLGWIFYVLVILIVAVGIIYPVIQIARRPVFSLYQLRDERGHAKQRRCRMLADNLIQNTPLTDAEVAQLEGYLTAGDKTDDLLIAFFEEKCTPQIDAATRRSATTAFFATAVSHSALVDTVTMLSVCLDLVRSIVQTCGFRPTNISLARLYLRVMLSALVAGGIDEVDLDGLIGTALGGGTGARGAGILLGSVTSGLVDAFLVFRVGVITKRWLCSADGPAQMTSIRHASYREALSLMRTSGFMNDVADFTKQTASAAANATATAVKTAATNATEAATSAAKQAVKSTARHTAEAAATAAGVATGVAASAAETLEKIFHRHGHDIEGS